MTVELAHSEVNEMQSTDTNYVQNNVIDIFWHSSPAQAGESLLLSGGGFTDRTVVEMKCDSSEEAGKHEWETVRILQQTAQAMTVTVPESWPAGVYACRVSQDHVTSREVLVNRPDVWWTQGEGGAGKARSGGWLRVLGNCLDLTPVTVGLQSDANVYSPEVVQKSNYSIELKIPVDMPVGEYDLVMQCGGREYSTKNKIVVTPPRQEEHRRVNVLDFDADPTGKSDCTLAVVQGLERLSGLGGGELFFPAGRYRIDSGLRTGTYIESGLIIPENVTFRGEGMDLVSLWWPDREKPLPSLIECQEGAGIQDLAIYTQGVHSTIVTVTNNSVINRVRIRANCYYMTVQNGRPHHLRGVDAQPAASGAAFLVMGSNNHITDCDIYNSTTCFDIRSGKGCFIARNNIVANSMQFINGGCQMIFEYNTFMSNGLCCGGNNIAMHMGSQKVYNVYYAHNHVKHIYGGDHEALTFDGHAVAYFGKIKDIGSKRFSLKDKLLCESGIRGKGLMKDVYDTVIYIVDGKGVGQYRWIGNAKDGHYTITEDWGIQPDENSTVLIGGYNGRHIIVGNIAEDTGTSVQLYPPNCECIVAENVSIRASNINCLGKISWVNKNYPRVEPSWYNQFIGNHIQVGNGWGGGTTEIDRWIGGEGYLNIWGWQVVTNPRKTGDVDRFLTPEQLREMLQEKKVRERSIPLCRYIVIRNHQIDNNSSIRIRGCVSDVLIEGCIIKKSCYGIRVEKQIAYQQPEDLGQLFDFDPVPGEGVKEIDFLSPSGVVLKNNQFCDVKHPYLGSAIDNCTIIGR